MTSWKGAADRYDKEEAAKKQREAEKRTEEERAHNALLNEVAKADRLVQDFLRSARSVGNPGAKGVTYQEVGLFFRKRIPKGVGYWSVGRMGGVEVRADGLWKRGFWSSWEGITGFEMGRNLEGLYYKTSDTANIASEIDALQQDLIAFMREHGIPIPS